MINGRILSFLYEGKTLFIFSMTLSDPSNKKVLPIEWVIYLPLISGQSTKRWVFGRRWVTCVQCFPENILWSTHYISNYFDVYKKCNSAIYVLRAYFKQSGSYDCLMAYHHYVLTSRLSTVSHRYGGIYNELSGQY